MKFKSVLILAALAPIFPSYSRASTTLNHVIVAAEKASNILSATQTREEITERAVSIAKGDYLPHLEADAIDTGGFSGSSSTLGIGGLVGSPYRSGAAVGLVATTTVWDFGRTSSSVRAAEHLSQAQKSQTELTRYDTDIQAAQLFFDCVRYRSQLDAWTEVIHETTLVSNEVEKFVKTGQRSIVERYLSKAQLEEAQTNQADLMQRWKLAERRLQVLTRLPLEELECPTLQTISPLEQAPSPNPASNPLLERAAQNALAAQAQVDLARADFMPKLKAFAAVGALENSRVISKQDYAVGVGVTLPLFDGLKTVNSLESAKTSRLERERLLSAAQDEIDQINVRYDQIIESSRVRLAHLQDELSLANNGFGVAKNRYFSLQGSLVDLREALRNLMRTRTEAIDTRASFYLTVIERSIFNGEFQLK